MDYSDPLPQNLLMFALLWHLLRLMRPIARKLELELLLALVMYPNERLAVMSEAVAKAPASSVVSFRSAGIFGHKSFLLNNPEHVRQVLQDKNKFVTLKINANHVFVDSVQNSGDDPQLWFALRRSLMPFFTKELPKTIPSVVEYFENDVASWAADAINLHDAFQSGVIRAQMKVFFSYDIVMNDPQQRTTRTFIEIMNSLVYEKQQPEYTSGELEWVVEQADALLDSARDGTLGAELKTAVRELGLGDEVLRNNARLLLASFTPTYPLFWTILSLLREGPAMLRRARDDPEFLQRCVKEAMRLYPPVPILTERCVRSEHDFGDGFVAPQGAELIIAPAWMVGDPQFNPDRWLNARTGNQILTTKPIFKNASQGVDYSYLPFAGGAHQCMARFYAADMVPKVLSVILQKLDFSFTAFGDPLVRLPLARQRMSHFGIFH